MHVREHELIALAREVGIDLTQPGARQRVAQQVTRLRQTTLAWHSTVLAAVAEEWDAWADAERQGHSTAPQPTTEGEGCALPRQRL